jgi:CTP-dependent riboflavin kinase
MMALSDNQLDYLADFERMQKDPERHAVLWATKWGKRPEIQEWMADPEFNDAYLTLRKRFGLPNSINLGGGKGFRIAGRISSGCGQAHLQTNTSHDWRLKDFGAPVERGTLNVAPVDLAEAVALFSIATPTRSQDAPTDRKGHLFLWSVLLHHSRENGSPVPCFLIRHERNALDYLELMGRYHFRKVHGFKDGDAVEIELKAWNRDSGLDATLTNSPVPS